MILFFLLLLVIEMLLSRSFGRLYTGSKRLWFGAKITWLKQRQQDFENEDKKRIATIILLRNASYVLALVLIGLYLLGNVIGHR